MRNYEPPAGLSDRPGIWDIHTHILPGVDDGSRDWDMTLAMLNASWDQGVRTIVATPHYLPWQNSHLEPERILDLCEETMLRARDALGIEMVVLPGEELYYHSGLLQDLKEHRAIPLCGSRVILVEFAEGKGSYSEMRSGLRGLSRAGYTIILAHAERYLCLRKEENLEGLLDDGVYIQSNLQEVTGGLLNGLSRWVRRQYAEETIGFTASDMHNLTTRPPMSRRELAWFDARVDSSYREDLFRNNARRLLLS